MGVKYGGTFANVSLFASCPHHLSQLDYISCSALDRDILALGCGDKGLGSIVGSMGQGGGWPLERSSTASTYPAGPIGSTKLVVDNFLLNSPN